MDQHPWVLWAGVVAAVIATAATALPRVREVFRPIYTFWVEREIRRVERQLRLDTARDLLSDYRAGALSAQLTAVSTQVENLARARSEDAERHERQRREDRARHESEMAELTRQLAEARAEIAALRTELAQYRGVGHGEQRYRADGAAPQIDP
ncbi:hypothetical protein [Nocardia colli]|uniref:hypothetical protein n=1 Tax=Nocardia colli TaxID=2545717 RepID=UPI0035DE966D